MDSQLQEINLLEQEVEDLNEMLRSQLLRNAALRAEARRRRQQSQRLRNRQSSLNQDELIVLEPQASWLDH